MGGAGRAGMRARPDALPSSIPFSSQPASSSAGVLDDLEAIAALRVGASPAPRRKPAPAPPPAATSTTTTEPALIDDDDDTLLASRAAPMPGGHHHRRAFSDAYVEAAAALRAELAECADPEDVLDVAGDEVGGGLGPAGAAAALERLAALARAGKPVAAVCERSPAFLVLLDEVEACAPAMRHRDLGQAAWALGAVGALRGRSAAAARALAAAAAARPSALSSRDHAALFHGLGKLRADPGRDALASLAAAAAADLASASPQSLSMLVWGVAELSGRGTGAGGALVAAVAAEVSARAATLGPQALAVVLASLARLGHEPDAAFVEAVGEAVAAAAEPGAVAAADAAAARAAAGGAAAPPRSALRPRELTSTLFALAQWRAAHPAALDAAAARLAAGGAGPRGEAACDVDWATAAWALATLGLPSDHPAWPAIETQLAAASGRLPARELGQAVWGLAVAGRVSTAAFLTLYTASLAAAETKWPLDPRTVSQIARAAASAAALGAAVPSPPPRLAAAAAKRAAAALSRSPLSLTHARLASLAKELGLPVEGVRVALGPGLPAVDIALDAGSGRRAALQVHCPRELPPGKEPLGRAASAAALLRALGWEPVLVGVGDVPAGAPRAAQAAALLALLRAALPGMALPPPPDMAPSDFVAAPKRRGGGRGGGGGGRGSGGRGDRDRPPRASRERAPLDWGQVSG